jgi:hypothetical protein
MNKTSLLTLLAASPALIALGPVQELETIAFRPAEGAAVTKAFRNTMRYDLTDMEVLMNGEENGMMPRMDMEMETVSSIVVTDTYGKVDGGRPESLLRSYDGVELEFNMAMSAEGGLGGGAVESPQGTGSSPLQGREVGFTWDSDKDDYELSWADSETGEDVHLLRDLTEDMDVRGLLPSKNLAVGERYEIPLIALVDVLAPGGDLKLDMDLGDAQMAMGSMGTDPQMMSNIRQMFGDQLEGSATGTLREVVELDGSRIAVIDLDIQVDTTSDMTDILVEIMDEQAQEGMEFTLDRADVEFALDATGELHWNISKGHVHALDLEGESAMAMDMGVNVDFGGQTMDLDMSMEMEGELESSIRTR